MKFPYKKSKIGNLKPIIKITVAALNGTDAQKIPAWMLADTGSDVTIFDIQIAEILGIDTKKIKPFKIKGIGKGEIDAYPAKVKIIFDNHPVPCNVMFGDVGDNGYGILGHIGFFEHFRATFDTRGKTIEIEHNWKL